MGSAAGAAAIRGAGGGGRESAAAVQERIRAKSASTAPDSATIAAMASEAQNWRMADTAARRTAWSALRSRKQRTHMWTAPEARAALWEAVQKARVARARQPAWSWGARDDGEEAVRR